MQTHSLGPEQLGREGAQETASQGMALSFSQIICISPGFSEQEG